MDFALSQLITDTGDVRSAIHGHSLARDMYGSDANNNGYLPLHPTLGTPFYITATPQPLAAGLYSDPDQHPVERPQLLRLHLLALDRADLVHGLRWELPRWRRHSGRRQPSRRTPR